MSTEKYDAIVIGAGLGGLSAAGYLAKAGKKVLALEHHTVPGGYAHEFRRGKYRFEVALHALDGAGPGGWAYPALSELEVLDQVTFHRMDPFYTVRFPGREITAHADMVQYEGELIRQFPEEAAGIRQLVDAMLTVFFEVRRFMVDGELGVRPSMAQMPARYPNMLAAMSQNWAEFMGQYIHDPELQGVFTTLWAYYGLPPEQLSAATFIFPWVSYHLFGAYYPEGGSMAMSRALEATINKYGGEVRYKQTVTKIEIEDGKATAVLTDKGLRAEADLIISNANPPDTMLKFVGREHLPERYVAKVEDALQKPALSNLVVYLGLERDLLAEGWPYHELFLAETYDPAEDYDNMVNGRFSQAGLVISHYDQADPGCAPEGGSVITITALAAWDYADQWGTGGDPAALHPQSKTYYRKNPQYQELKQAAGDALIDQVEKVIPGLRQSIKYVEVATPLTNYRYSLNPGGSIYGSEQTVDNMYLNRLSEKTPIPNLFLAGAWVTGGGMSAAMLSGRSAARRALARLDGVTVAPQMTVDVPETTEEEPPISQSPISIPEAPDVTLTAVQSNREINLKSLGQTAVLVFHTQDTRDAAKAVNLAVRSQYPLAADVLIASVLDLSGVPRMFRKIAESAMNKAYQKMADSLPAGFEPAEYLLMLPDWDGAATRAFGLSGVDKQAAVVVLAANGDIAGVSQESDLGGAVV
ncbi:MAG TPA: NAD(P)/FAD-dependent oxidoreductase [Anaerolineae bacterium]|nr:NAD(P)/FAD-dependent oxidoreductase [Anaerolineae bacterium]